MIRRPRPGGATYSNIRSIRSSLHRKRAGIAVPAEVPGRDAAELDEASASCASFWILSPHAGVRALFFKNGSAENPAVATPREHATHTPVSPPLCSSILTFR